MTSVAPSSILFACTSNSVRSPIAAALARHHLSNTTQVECAGVDPREVDAFAVAVMAEVGLDLSLLKPKSLPEVDAARFDLIVCLTEEAHREARALSCNAVEFWAISDPTVERDRGRGRDQILAAYRQVRDDIDARIRSRFGGAGRRPAGAA